MPGIKDLNHLTQPELALLWEVSTRTIQRKPEAEPLRHGSGQGCYYVWSECRAFEKAQMSQARDGGEDHGERLKKVKADEAEVNFAVKMGSLLVATDVRETWANECAAMRARLLSIPASAALKIDPHMTQAQREDVIRRDIYEALESLAAGDLPGEAAS